MIVPDNVVDARDAASVPVMGAPHSLRAERSVLGSMLLSQNAMDIAIERLKSTDFYTPAHQDIFLCMSDMRSLGVAVDAVTLVAELEKRGKLEQIGDASYIVELAASTPSAANIEQYVLIVEERSVLRALIRAGNDIAKDSVAQELPLLEIINDAERRIYDISMRNTADTLLPVQSTMYDTYARLGTVMQDKGKLKGLATGFIDLDAMTSGLQKSDLVIIAGRPAMGKTSFVMNIAQHAALHEGASVVVFSLEMSRDQLITRMFCTEAEVDMGAIKLGTANHDDIMKITDVLPYFENSKLFIDDSAGATVPEIRSKCRRHKAKHGLDLIAIDYLQLMHSPKKTDSRQLEISELTRSLKVLARELDVPILLLSQLSRGPENRADHRPMMSDLRESGAIEQDADIIMMLYREQVYDETADSTANVIVAKHRNGSTGTIDLVWQGEYTKFKNMARM